MVAKRNQAPLTRKSSSKKKQPAAVETSESIDEQVKAFLKSGRNIEVV